jgi:hypothetical protein
VVRTWCLLASSVLLLALSSQLLAQSQPIDGSPSSAQPLLKERPIRVLPDGLSINVQTGGCTDKQDFRLGTDANGIALLRQTPDTCKGWFPQGKWIDFTWAELATVGITPSMAKDAKAN